MNKIKRVLENFLQKIDEVETFYSQLTNYGYLSFEAFDEKGIELQYLRNKLILDLLKLKGFKSDDERGYESMVDQINRNKMNNIKYAIYTDSYAGIKQGFDKTYFINKKKGTYFTDLKSDCNIKNAYLFEKRADAEAFINFAAQLDCNFYIEEVKR